VIRLYQHIKKFIGGNEMLKNQYYIELNKDIINSYDMERILGALEAEEEYNEKFDKEPYKGHIIPVTREGNHSLYLKVKSISGNKSVIDLELS
jgi:hypothetical protein